MFRIRGLSPKDFAFAVRLTNEMKWGLTEEDFEFAMELEPDGCFVLVYGSEEIGIVTNLSFGKIGWLGNLLVSENHRERGGGSLLVEQSIRYLRNRNAETVGLYAHPNRVPFYRRFGFEYDSDFIVLRGKGFSSSVRANIKEAGERDVAEVVDCDRCCLDVSRGKLLEPILIDADNLCFTFNEGKQVQGYAVAKVYRGMAEIGPLVCRQGEDGIAIDLIKAILNALDGLEVSVCIPKKRESLLKTLMRSGFREGFHLVRMFHGPPMVGECIYAAESLERG